MIYIIGINAFIFYQIRFFVYDLNMFFTSCKKVKGPDVQLWGRLKLTHQDFVSDQPGEVINF